MRSESVEKVSNMFWKKLFLLVKTIRNLTPLQCAPTKSQLLVWKVISYHFPFINWILVPVRLQSVKQQQHEPELAIVFEKMEICSSFDENCPNCQIPVPLSLFLRSSWSFQTPTVRRIVIEPNCKTVCTILNWTIGLMFRIRGQIRGFPSVTRTTQQQRPRQPQWLRPKFAGRPAPTGSAILQRDPVYATPDGGVNSVTFVGVKSGKKPNLRKIDFKDFVSLSTSIISLE